MCVKGHDGADRHCKRPLRVAGAAEEFMILKENQSANEEVKARRVRNTLRVVARFPNATMNTEY